MIGDVVRYARLMEADEEDTHSRLRQLKLGVVEPIIASHAGTVLKDTGDGFLAVFDAPIRAVQCASALQTALVERAADYPPERRIVFRLGLNICETIVEPGDVFGDGVNIAARLQAFAEPGDFVMTVPLAQMVSRELAPMSTFELGDLHLKNINRLVQAVGVRIGSLRNLAAPPPLKSGDSRPSIAVLPFRRPPGSNVDAYVIGALVEEIIHGLATTQTLFVISPGSTKRYAGKMIDAREVGKELDVRYVLNGSVQRSGDRLRINTELADATTGTIIRHDRFEGAMADLFELQEQIAIAAVKVLAPNILDWDLRQSMRKRPDNLSAHELVLNALEHLFRLGQESHSRARGLLQQAIALDPDYAPAYSYTAYWHVFRVGEGWSSDADVDRREAGRLAQLAIERDGKDAFALAIYGHVEAFLLRDFDTANAILDRAIEVGPNCAMAWAMSSVTRGYLGDGRSAVERAETGLRLSPLDGHAFWFEGMLAQAHYVNRDYELAVAWARRAAAQNPSAMFNLRVLAASLAALGRELDARRVAKDILAKRPTFNLETYEKDCPFSGEALKDWIGYLHAAGLPLQSSQ